MIGILCPVILHAQEANTEMLRIRDWYRAAIEGEAIQEDLRPPLLTVKRQDHGNLQLRKSIWGTTPICIGQQTFEHGLGTHADSEFLVELASAGSIYKAKIGVDNNFDTKGRYGSVDFAVLVGGEEVFHSPVLRCGEEAVPIEIPLHGAREFTLRVGDGGDGQAFDQCDWADAQVVLEDETALWLDEMRVRGPQAGPEVTLPFSFVCGGVPSAKLLQDWRRTQKSEPCAFGTRDTITYTDPESGLVVTCEAKRYDQFPAVEWVLYFENTGSGPTPMLENVQALDLTVRQGIAPGFVLHHSQGSNCTTSDFLPTDRALALNQTVALAPQGGRSSDTTLPFFNLEWGGGGAVVAIGWSGQWRAEFARDASMHLRCRAGMEHLRARLNPGERIRTPRILMCWWEGAAPIRGNNLFRRLVVAHYTPTVNGKPVLPPLAMAPAGNELNECSEQNQLSVMADIATAGLEAFWLDAGWFSGGWPGGVGSWDPRPERFPEGLAPLGRRAHELGLKFVLWFEPERVSPASRIAQQHPEFVLHAGEGDGLFNLGDPQARRWLTDEISRRITDWGIDIYRHDFNIQPLPFWQAADALERQGITEIRYIEGLYAFWDELRRRHPDLAIDNCASGGRRIDLETISRSFPLWRSDLQCGGDFPTPSQAQTAGLSLYVPIHSAGNHDWDTYITRSAATLGVAYAPMVMAEGIDVAKAQPRAAEIKRLRPFWLGDYYPLLPINPDEHAWCAMQFHRADLDAGMVLVFRRAQSPYSAVDLRLEGLDPDADYALTDEDAGNTLRQSGAELSRLSVLLAEAPASKLLTYRREP